MLISLLLAVGAYAGRSDLQNTDASQWSGNQVYQVLHNSPWTTNVKVKYSSKDSSGSLNDQTAPTAPSAPPAPMAGGTGRRGMGGGGSRSYSSGQGGQRGQTSSPKLAPEEVTIQWQSAEPVRLAAAKMAVENAGSAPENPADSYVVAVIGLPLADFGGRAATADSDQSSSPEDMQALAQRLKSSASLLRPGHEPLTATNVLLDQGVDGRTVFYFPKRDPIAPKDKTVEFRLASGHAEIHKKFVLKEMEYKGQLGL